MVGVGDIPCVGKFVERISDKTVDALFRGFRYVFRYKALVDQLNAETAKLNIEKDNMSEKIREEEAHGKVIKDHVLKWQKDVQEIQNSADQELSPSCICIQRLPIPNPVSRFRIGRNAAKKAKTVIELAATGKDYRTGGIANLPPVRNMPKSDTAFEKFQSRKDVYGKLWEGLVNKDSPLVHGIYGMAGVGKTRMMEQLWEDAMTKQIFNKVVRVNVGSENLNEYELQDQIAARLDCKLESQDVESRASQLENSLRNGGKILLILDDVWREIPLGRIIGTPFGDDSSSKGSKILLTSRQKGVCEVNKCEHPVEVKTLSPDEALDLFMNTVRPDTINSLPDQSLVKKVCDECGQLPLLILAVGKALKRKRQNSWAYALNQLQKGKFENIPGVDRRVYACIKLSIDFLEHDDAKSCLFLCCLFPEDANIDMKMLIQLATGSQLIGDGESSVLAMVDSLKDSSLLLDSGRYNETKVHDIIRDVARNLASTDSKYAFLHVKCNSWHFPSDDVGYCTRKLLRLDAETDVHFEEHPVFPDLHTMWLQCNNHPQQFLGGFFRMFANLRFLMLQNVNISLEQFSLQPLGKLGTLSLIKCDISKTDVSLFPKSLKTLCISFCKLPSPLDVANLKYLRKLEIQEWSKFVMGSNVISSLSRLEELHIPNGYIIDLEEYEIDPIVTEISELTRLKSLQFHFYLGDTFRGRIAFSDIDRYIIFVGDQRDFDYVWEGHPAVPLRRVIRLFGNHLHSWEGLMARAEEVRLGYSDFQVSSICKGHRGAFEDLKRLYMYECGNMGHLASISQDEIQYSLHSTTCFSKLVILEIKSCSKLKYLFCNKIAKSLVQLQDLSVKSCYSMEAIIVNDGKSDGAIINFPKLKSLKMSYMERLAIFCAEKKNMHPGSTLSVEHQSFFDGMVPFPSLEKLRIKSCYNRGHLARMSQDENQNSLQHGVTCFSKVTILKIKNCSELKYLFCNKIAKSLAQLQELIVESCESMEAIIMNEGTIDGEIIIFPRLKSLKMDNVPRLASFYAEKKNMHPGSTVPMDNSAQHQPFFDGMVAFPFLEKMYIRKCDNMRQLASISQDEIQYSLQHGATPFSKLTILEIKSCSKLKYLFCNNIANQLVQLQELSIGGSSIGGRCESMEAIIMNEGTSDGKIINFPKLKLLEMDGMPRLASFYVDLHSASTLSIFPSARYQHIFDRMVAFPSLKKLDIRRLQYTSVVWEKDCFDNDTLSSFCKLKHLSVSFCDKLEIVIPMLHRLNNLECIKVYECSSLRTVFLPSVARDLTHLKELKVEKCGEMRDIIEAGEQVITDDDTFFPELTVLELVKLPSLTSFWCYQNGKANTRKVTYSLPRLSSVVLSYLPHPRSFFHGENFEFHMPALEEVEVRSCGLSTLFTFSMFTKFHLERLLVADCELLENIVEDLRGDETCDKIITLFQLTSVKFKNLPNLKCFFHNANYEFHMPVMKEVIVLHCGFCNTLFTRSVFRNLKELEVLRVSDCKSLEGIFEDARVDEICEKIIRLNRVSRVHLRGLPKLKSIFYGATYECYMPALENVKIVGCGLSVLFTCSMFREIQQLKELHVSNCESLEHIVKEVGSDHTSEINGKSITSYKLSSITLQSLPNLKSFSCTPSYVFNMPKLEYFTFSNCPRIEYFSASETNAPLVYVNMSECSAEAFTDVNDYIRQIAKEKV